MLAHDNRLHDQYAMLLEQHGDLITNRRQRSYLNLHQPIRLYDIDSKPPELLLDSAPGVVYRFFSWRWSDVSMKSIVAN